MSLENLVGISLDRIDPSEETVTRLLAAAERNIKDSQVAAVSAENRFDAAYKAVMQLGTVALHAHGCRPNGYEAAFLSGGGAYQSLDLFLAGIIDKDILAMAGVLLAIKIDPDAPIHANVAAALGIEAPAARERFYRDHPVMILMQWLGDPADPSTFAGDETLPVTLVIGVGGLRVPNLGTEGLMELLPQGAPIRCEPTADYDLHVCMFREQVGIAVLQAWLAQ